MLNYNHCAFIGEHTLEGKPNGFVRIVNRFGNIFEGMISEDGKMNGFCVTYLGIIKTIELGWFKGNRKHGNWMAINTNDMSIKKSGWFKEDNYVCEM